MSKLGNLVALVGAGLGGYAKGVGMREDRERADRREAREDEEYQHQRRQRERTEKLERDLAESQKDVELEQGTTTTGTNLYTNAEDAATDNRELQRFSRQQAESTGTGFGVQPPKQTFRVGKQMIADQGAAQEAMLGVNSQAAKMDRAAKVHAEAGNIEKARQFRDFASQALNEGTDKVFAAIESAAPSVEALKKANGTIESPVGKDAAEIYNRTGGRWKVAPDTKVQYFLEKDAAGREVVNARVLRGDGTPMVGNVKQAALMLADFKTRLDAEQNDTRTFQTGQQIAETARGNQVAEKQRDRQINLQERQLAQSTANHAASTPAGQIAAKEKALGRPLTQDEKLTLLGIDKLSQTDRIMANNIVKELEQISNSQNKAMAEGSWQPESPGAKAQAERAALLQIKLGGIMKPYQGGVRQGGNDDPLGILPKPAAAPASGAAAVPPSSQAPARGVQGTPAQMAVAQLDTALAQTGRDIAAAQAAGNQQEVQRLLAVMQEQQQARIAALGQAKGA